eukprot:1123066-Rhodomonas_salina.1
MKSRKAQGQDKMLPELWKEGPTSLLQTLCNAINNALITGKMPDEWRDGTIRFLLKKEPSTLLSNWRPVCLLATAYKVYAVIINHSLKTIVE